MAHYKQLVKEITEEEFNEFVQPFLPTKISGTTAKVPFWKVYNYIAKVLRTGMQWSELQGYIDRDSRGKSELHYTTVFKRFSLWTAFNVFEQSHQAILSAAHKAGQIDLSIINGDGTNSIAKKGAMHVGILGTNIRQVQSV